MWENEAMKQLNNGIIKVLKYFSFFAYYPTLEEIHTFLPVKISKTKLEGELKRFKYTPVEYSIRRKISQKKLNNWRFQLYIKLISLFPQIRLIGLSGSISMMNAKEDDDIDLFIITARNRLFTGRLITLVLAQLLGLRRHRQIEKLDALFSTATPQRGPLAIVSKKASSLLTNHQSLVTSHYKNKVCLNLFFDENNLKVPKFKQTEFVGHEVLQMKPIIVKGNVYERFLEENRWVFKIFPNANENLEFKIQNSEFRKKIINSKLIHNYKFIILNFGRKIELILKKIQLNSINKHKTSEIITPSQLWFHPDDFEKRIKIK